MDVWFQFCSVNNRTKRWRATLPHASGWTSMSSDFIRFIRTIQISKWGVWFDAFYSCSIDFWVAARYLSHGTKPESLLNILVRWSQRAILWRAVWKWHVPGRGPAESSRNEAIEFSYKESVSQVRCIMLVTWVLRPRCWKILAKGSVCWLRDVVRIVLLLG